VFTRENSLRTRAGIDQFPPQTSVKQSAFQSRREQPVALLDEDIADGSFRQFVAFIAIDNFVAPFRVPLCAFLIEFRAPARLVPRQNIIATHAVWGKHIPPADDSVLR